MGTKCGVDVFRRKCFVAHLRLCLSARYRGHLSWSLVFRAELTGVFHVCYSIIEPSSQYVYFTDKFQHLGARWMKIPLSVQQYFLDDTYGCLNVT